ncbi:unnamed protein product [Cylindrotheca closterium]|uniref:Uncharacterized protein n=1 Tax=Cylindrotheca closterium TaxID=2856 RepID=A0AAD2JGR1_9STRA|nr:unnamed protein product [Cylindrotheca closterium]
MMNSPSRLRVLRQYGSHSYDDSDVSLNSNSGRPLNSKIPSKAISPNNDTNARNTSSTTNMVVSSIFYNPTRRRTRHRRSNSNSSIHDKNGSSTTRNNSQRAYYDDGFRSNPAARCLDAPTAHWMNWVEHSIDFFGCDAQNEGFLGKALAELGKDRNASNKGITDDRRDYCQMHEEFFESLLKEQLLLQDYSQELAYSSTGISDLEEATSFDSNNAEDDLLHADDTSIVSNNSTASLNPISTSSITPSTTSEKDKSATPPPKKKERRIPYFHKISPRRKRVAPIEAYNRQYNPELFSSDFQKPSKGEIHLDGLIQKRLPEPISFVHPHAQLQKDKGRGVALGSNICAEGKDATLEKLRDKMKLVIQVRGNERKSSLLKRDAKISQETPSFIETRSMIEMKLGFLSLQYGLLLRWDRKTGKVRFVCLRKMCHESFYKVAQQQTSTIQAIQIQKSELDATPFIVTASQNGIGGANHAIYQRVSGTEVVFVSEPYRIEPPDSFAPSIITLQIQSVTGIHPKQKWSMNVTFAGHSEMAILEYSKDKKRFVPKRPSMVWEVPQQATNQNNATNSNLETIEEYNGDDEEKRNDLDPSLLNLEIRLFEKQKRRSSSSRLSASMTLPLASLIAQPTATNFKSWSLTMPFGNAGKLTLNLQHRSDYTHWLYRELDQRRLEEVSCLQQEQEAWNRQQQEIWEEQPASPDFYDWLCGVCLQ